MQKIRVASRGSTLALTQTKWVIKELSAYTNLPFEIIKITTQGDKGNLSEVGAFTSAIEQALINNEADLAIHSYKDLPTENHPSLSIAAVPKREDVRDVFISEKYTGINQLPGNSIIGTGSPRRNYQLKALNPNWNIKFINGNIDTRIKKMQAGNYDAIVLAAAGLHRIGWHNKISQYFELDELVPAPAQGALAIQTNKSNYMLKEICQNIHCKKTEIAVNTERQILKGVGGGCKLPIAAHLQFNEDSFTLNALFGLNENRQLNKITTSGNIEQLKEASETAINKLKTNTTFKENGR